jgi:hypothetical protein
MQPVHPKGDRDEGEVSEMSVVETLPRAALPAEFLLLFVVALVSATAIVVCTLVMAERERRDREKRGHSSGL